MPPTACRRAALLTLPALLALAALSRAQDEPKTDNTEYLRVAFAKDFRFGFTVAGDPKVGNKQLTYAPDGSTNNTVVRINGRDFILHLSARADPFKVTAPTDVKSDKTPEGRDWSHTWEVANPKVTITQTILLRRGSQTRKFDTAVVMYTLANNTKVKQKLGVRFMMDTLIGANDGVPFAVPERPDLVTTRGTFSKKAKDLPDYVQAFENPDIKNPGTVAHLGVKVSGHLASVEAPDAVQIAAWPNPDTTGWLAPYRDFNRDSMIALYWEEATVEPGAQRTVGISYGLAKVASGGSGGKIGLTVGGNFKSGGVVTLTAYLDKDLKKPTVTLTLPEGLSLEQGQPAKRTVAIRPTDPYGRCAWRIKCDKAGTYEVKAVLDDGSTETLQLVVK